MPKYNSNDSAIIKRLELWAIKYYYLQREHKKISLTLAEKGYLAKQENILVTPRDSFEVAKQKEELIKISKNLNNMKKIFSSIGAKILDNETLEIVFPGGPNGTYFSWQPGEKSLSYCKKGHANSISRNHIKGAPKPTYH